MNLGSDPADQVVRYTLEGSEFALKMTGTAANVVVQQKGYYVDSNGGATDPAKAALTQVGAADELTPDAGTHFVVKKAAPADPWEPLPTATPAPGAAAGVLDSTPKTGDVSFDALALAGLAFAALGVAAKRKLG